MPGIIVGIDGSSHSARAVEWALNEAANRHAPLTVLTVHSVAVTGWSGTPILAPGDAEDQEKARRAAEEITLKAATSLARQSQRRSQCARSSASRPRNWSRPPGTLTCWLSDLVARAGSRS